MPELILKADDDYLLNVRAALHLADANPSALMMLVTACVTEVYNDLSLV